MNITLKDVGTFALRVATGMTVAAHGAQKLFGAFNGPGLSGTADYFDALGFRPGRLNALVAGSSEMGGGTLLAIGMGTPGAGAAVAGTMIVAAASQAPKGFFNATGGLEYPGTLAVVAASITLTGPGRLSVDHALGHRLDKPWMRVLALVAAMSASGGMLALRRQSARRDAGPSDHSSTPPAGA